jgi:hypothetical protein
MRMMRSVAAIVAGLGFMAATVTVGTLVGSSVLGTATGAARPSEVALATSLYANLVICAVGGVLGGWLAARIASYAPYGHASAMAAIVAVLSITTAAGVPAADYPDWYPSALGVVAVAGILLGGKLRALASAEARRAEARA